MLVLAVVMVVGGLVWLAWLRSRASSLRAAVHEHQIQGFNGICLAGIGAITGLMGVIDLLPALAPYREVIRFVVMPVWILAMVWVTNRLLPRGSFDRRG